MKPLDSSTKIFVITFMLLLLIFTSTSTNILAQPTGVTIVSNSTDIIPQTPAASITTPGGSFTTLVLNGTFQTQKWKAYVGNVSGVVVLQDSSEQRIYDWNLAVISGEVYVSRNETVQWTGISCADQTAISTEDTYLTLNSSKVDSINNTFNNTIHKEFYVGTTKINASSCRSIATYVNGVQQTLDENADFQEVILEDPANNVVFTTILENSQQGYNLDNLDFQLIVPEDETNVNPTPYYFYVEIS